MSTLLSACAPPLMMFIIGTGSVFELPRRRNSDCLVSFAIACAAASETASSAFAPSRDLVSVPSSAIIAWSIAA
jgi:hypothetical protein